MEEGEGFDCEHGPNAGTLVIRRRRGLLIDVARSYRIVINGQNAGRLTDNSEAAFSLPPGTHTAQFRIDWTGSDPLTFEVEPGERTTLLVEYVGKLLSRTRYLRFESVP